MKKIVVDKAEGIAEVIDRLLNEPDKEVTLVIPKGSALGRSVSNFHLLKREADSAGRNIVVESVDDTILAFAKESDLDASHPLWRRMSGSGVGISDIVARTPESEKDETESGTDEEDDEPEEEVRPAPVMANKKRSKKEEKKKEEEEMEKEEEDEREEERPAPIMAKRSNYERDEDDDDVREGMGGYAKTFIIIGIVVVVVVAAVIFVDAFFARADVAINFKQTPWTYQNNFTADKALTQPDSTGLTIPATVFTSNKNVTQTFQATGSSNATQKAQGNIVIHNNYSADTQDLVKNTRFQTPDGKVFRITQDVTVPGKPGTISVPIVADQAGPTYDIGPTPKLTIPGFQNSPKFDGFYGEIVASTTGGEAGTHAVATAADIAAAKSKTNDILTASLTGGFAGNYPNNYKILDGATQIQVSKLTVNTSTDANGNFTVFGEATLQAIGFDESALKTYLLSLAQATEQDSVFKDVTPSYSNVKADFTKGTVSFTLAVQADLEPQFSVSDFQSTIAGKSIGDARGAIANLPNLADGKISVWPFWLWSIPSNTAKIHVTSQ